MGPRRRKPVLVCSAYAAPNTLPVLKLAVEELGWRLVDKPKTGAGVYWVCQKEMVVKLVRELPPSNLVGRYPRMSTFCKKVPFNIIMRQAAAVFPGGFRFWPETYCLPQDAELVRREMDAAGRKTFFIVKPDGGSQGDGIFLTNSWNDMEARLGGFPANGQWVVQRYSCDPYLIDGVKFDLRLYAVLTSAGGCFRAFLCREGLVRLCTEPYRPPTMATRHHVNGHLTNYSLNKLSKGFVRGHDDDPTGGSGSKRSLTSLLELLREKGEDVDALWDSLVTLVGNTAAALYGPVMEACESCKSSGRNLFQVLGFDVLLDKDLEPMLLELNNQPSLTIDTPVALDELPVESTSSGGGADTPDGSAIAGATLPDTARRCHAAPEPKPRGGVEAPSSPAAGTGSESESSNDDGSDDNSGCSSTSGNKTNSSSTSDSRLDDSGSSDETSHGSSPPAANSVWDPDQWDSQNESDDVLRLSRHLVQTSFKLGPAEIQAEARDNPELELEGLPMEGSLRDQGQGPLSEAKPGKEASVRFRFSPSQHSKGHQNGAESSPGSPEPDGGGSPLTASKMMIGPRCRAHPSGRRNSQETPAKPQASSQKQSNVNSRVPGSVSRTGNPTSETARGGRSAKVSGGGSSSSSSSPVRRPVHHAKPWGASQPKTRRNPYVVPQSSKPAPVLRDTEPQDVATPSGPSPPGRPTRLEATRPCTCKELQVPHRHVVSAVDRQAKLRVLAGALRIARSLQRGRDPMEHESVEEWFDECEPELEDAAESSAADEAEGCTTPLLLGLYNLYCSCSSFKSDGEAKVRQVESFKVRRMAMESGLVGPDTTFRAVDFDILFQRWRTREGDSQAACSKFIGFVELLIALVSRSLPGTPVQTALAAAVSWSSGQP